MSDDAQATSEAARIAATSEPRTRTGLTHDLGRLGVRPRDTVLVHSSLTSLGWVVGGQVTVVQALLDALGPDGTLVVPAQTGDNSDPKDWAHPPVPEAWWQVIRDHMPAFDPTLTPTRSMGVIAEAVRTWPGARRSDHPVTSFAAVGPLADEITAVHDLDCQLGERSPLAALERVGARGLLLGVGWDVCTSFHLAEYRVPGLARTAHGAAVRVPAADHAPARAWVTFDDVDVDSEDFEALGAAFEAADGVISGPVGSAQARLFSIPAAVQFAVDWLPEHRGLLRSQHPAPAAQVASS